MMYLSREALESLDITSLEAINYLEKLIRQQSEGKVSAAPKTALSTDDGRYMMATLSTSDDPPLMAVKGVLVNQKNKAQGRDAINGSIILLNSQTGETLAVLEGNWITAIRTAAASALVARYLANPNASTIAFIGCGVQAHSHLKVFTDLFPIKAIRALGKGTQNRDVLCDAARDIGLEALACSDAKQAVSDADIVISSIPLTVQVEPFIDAKWLKPGVFLSSTDLGMPWMPSSMNNFDRIIIDDFQQEAAMPDPMVDINLVQGDLIGLINGQVSARDHSDEKTAFIFRAVGLGDLALASLAYQKTQTV